MTYRVPQKGYIVMFKVGSVPTYIHWSFFAFGIVITAFLGKWSVSALAASALGYLLLVLVHEAGHAFFAIRAKVPVHAIVITGVGGVCYSGLPEGSLRQLLLHAGGLIAQAVLFILCAAYLLIFGYPELYAIKCFFVVLTLFNAILFVANIIPSRGNDGAKIVGSIKQMRAKP